MPWIAFLASKTLNMKLENSYIEQVYFRIENWSLGISLENISILNGVTVPNIYMKLCYGKDLEINLYDYQYQIIGNKIENVIERKNNSEKLISNLSSNINTFFESIAFHDFYNKTSKYLTEEIDIKFYRFSINIPGFHNIPYEIKPLSLSIKHQHKNDDNNQKNLIIISVQLEVIDVLLEKNNIENNFQNYSENQEKYQKTNLDLKIEENGIGKILLNNIPLHLLKYDTDNNINGYYNGEIDFALLDDWTLENAVASGKIENATLYIPSLWKEELFINSLYIQGSYNNSSEINFLSNVECNNLKFHIRYHDNKGFSNKINAVNNVSEALNSKDSITISLVNDLHISEILRYWPQNKAAKAKNWFENNLLNGTATDIKTIFYLDYDIKKKTIEQEKYNKEIEENKKTEEDKDKQDIKNEEKKKNIFLLEKAMSVLSSVKLIDFDLTTRIIDSKINYIKNNNYLILPLAFVKASFNNTHINAASGNIDQLYIENIQANVNYYDDKKIDISCNIDQNLTQVANYLLLSFYNTSLSKQALVNSALSKQDIQSNTSQAQINNQSLASQNQAKNFDGLSKYLQSIVVNNRQGRVKMLLAISIPLIKDVNFSDITFNISGHIHSKIKDLLMQISFNTDKKVIHFTSFFQKKDVVLKINGTKQIYNDSLVFDGSIELPYYWSGEAKVKGQCKKISKCKIAIDLEKNEIQIASLKLNKKSGESGSILLETFIDKNYENDIQINSYEIDVSHLISKGKARFNENGLVYLISDQTEVNGNNLKIRYEKNASGIKNLVLQGNHLDLSAVNIGDLLKKNTGSKISNFTVNIELEKITLPNNVLIHSPQFHVSFNEEKLSSVYANGLLDNGYFTLFYSYPQFSFVSNAAGQFLNGVQISKDIRDGMLEIKGIINESNEFDGIILMDNFKLKQSPVAATILRLSSISSSFTNLARIFDTQGIDFKYSGCELYYQDGEIQFKKCVAVGSTLLIKGGGNIINDNAYFSGVIIPLHLFNTILLFIKKISPKLGEVLMEGKGDRANFEIYKDGSNIKVKANPFSILLPGFLGGFFEYKQNHKKFVTETIQ